MKLNSPSHHPYRRGTIGTSNYLTPFPVIELSHDAVVLPNGTKLAYPEIGIHEWLDDAGHRLRELCYSDGLNGRKKIYGGKFTENVCQALTRIIVTDVAERVRTHTGYRPFMHTYDSLDWCVPESEVAMFDELVAAEFAHVPTWAPGLPLASEGGWGRTLLEAEKGSNT